MTTNYWVRHERETVTRRALLSRGGTATLGAAGLALVGCGGDSGKPGAPATPASPTAEPVTRGGTIRYPISGPAAWPKLQDSLAPFIGGFSNYLFAFHYSRLLRHVGAAGVSPSDVSRVEGDLAERWEQPDPLTYVFTFKPNVRWHDKPPRGDRF